MCSQTCAIQENSITHTIRYRAELKMPIISEGLYMSAGFVSELCDVISFIVETIILMLKMSAVDTYN